MGIDEILVRAVTLKYLDMGGSQRRMYLQRAMMNEYRSGYILERFFYESFDDYPKSGMSLRAYYPVMLQKLDVARELERWKEEGADSTRGQ